MANSYYQTPTTPRLYISYPLYQYASGALDRVILNASHLQDTTEEDLIRMIQLDPSNVTRLPITTDATYNYFSNFRYSVIEEEQRLAGYDMTQNPQIWNFNYAMILGHNFNTANARVTFKAKHEGGSSSILNVNSLVNYSFQDVPEYDGWSLAELTDTSAPQNDSYDFSITIDDTTSGSGAGVGYNTNELQIGSWLWGRYFDFPRHCNLSTSLSHSYGVKQKQTIAGKTISTANWTKTNNWITEPFGLGSENKDNFRRRSSRRTWSISFDSLDPKYVMNQNPMLNDNAWKAQDNHSTGADGEEVLSVNSP